MSSGEARIRRDNIPHAHGQSFARYRDDPKKLLRCQACGEPKPVAEFARMTEAGWRHRECCASCRATSRPRGDYRGNLLTGPRRLPMRLARATEALNVLAEYYEGTPEQVLMRSRSPYWVGARRVLYTILSEWAMMSVVEIAYFAGRDHSTLIHAMLPFTNGCPAPGDKDAHADILETIKKRRREGIKTPAPTKERASYQFKGLRKYG